MYSQRRGRSAAAASASSTAGVTGLGGSRQLSNGVLTDSQISNQLLNDDNDADGGSRSTRSSDGDDLEEYGDMHRLVLQGVMTAGYLDAKGVKRLFQESCKFLKCKVPAVEHMSPPYIQKVVREINERIKIFDMMIRSATCEITGEKFYVFLVTIERPIMKIQTYFTKMELDLFQKILESLLRKHNNFAISVAECINIIDNQESRAFSKVNAEDFVSRMTSMKYFTKVYKDKEEKEFDITLGFRTIREFEPIFREVYSDIFENCCLCKMILLNGLQCPKCPVVIHRACVKKYIKSCKTCTSCKAFWKNEDALPVRTRDRPALDLSTHSQQRAAESSQNNYDSNDDDIDMPVLEPVTSPRIARGSQSKKRQKESSKSPSKNKRASRRKIIVESSSDSSE